MNVQELERSITSAHTAGDTATSAAHRPSSARAANAIACSPAARSTVAHGRRHSPKRRAVGFAAARRDPATR